MNKRRASQIRKEIWRLRRQRYRCEKIAMRHGAMVAASLLERKMGPTEYTAYYLAGSIDGKIRHRYVPKDEVDYWERRAKEWQWFSKAMARWVKINKQIEKKLRELGQIRTEPMPGKGK